MTCTDHFRENVRNLMDARNVTYRKLAADLGASASSLNRMLNGEMSPKSETMEKIAGYFGVPLPKLLGPWRKKVS